MSVLLKFSHLNSLQINGTAGIGPTVADAPTTSVTLFCIIKLFDSGTSMYNVIRLGNAAQTKLSCRFIVNTNSKIQFVNNMVATEHTEILTTGKWYAVCCVWRIGDADPNIDYYVRDLAAGTTTTTSVNGNGTTWYKNNLNESLIGAFRTANNTTYTVDGYIECTGVWLEALPSPATGEALFNTYADSLASDKTLTNLGALSTPLFYDPLTEYSINKILDPTNDSWTAQVGAVTITPYYNIASSSGRRPISAIGHELPLTFEKAGSQTSWVRPAARFHPYPYHCTMTFANDMHSLDDTINGGPVFDHENTRKLWAWWNTSQDHFDLGPGPNLETSFSCWMANTEGMMDITCRSMDNFSYFEKNNLSTERGFQASTLRQAFQDEVVDSFHDYYDDHTDNTGVCGGNVPITFDQASHPQAVVDVFKDYNITFPRVWISHGNDFMGLAWQGTYNKLGDEPGSWYHLNVTRTTAADEAPGIGGAWWTWSYDLNAYKVGGTPDLVWAGGSGARHNQAFFPSVFDDNTTKTYYFARVSPYIILDINGTDSDDYGKFVSLSGLDYLIVKNDQIGSYTYVSDAHAVLIYNNGTNTTEIGLFHAQNFESEVDIDGNPQVGGAYSRWSLNPNYRDFNPTISGNFDLKFKIINTQYGNGSEYYGTMKDHFDTDLLDRYEREGILAILYAHPEYLKVGTTQDQTDSYAGLMELSNRFHVDRTIFVGSLNRVATHNLISNFVTYQIEDLGNNKYKITLDTTFDDLKVFTGTDAYTIFVDELRGLTFFRPADAIVQLWFNGKQISIDHNNPISRSGHAEDGLSTFSIPWHRICSIIFKETGSIRVENYQNITDFIGRSHAYAKAASDYWYDAAVEVVVTNDLETELDLVKPFIQAYRNASARYSLPPASGVESVRKLQEHVLRKSRKNDGERFTNINDWLAAYTSGGRLGDCDNSITVHPDFAELSTVVGYTIDSSNIR